MSSTDYAHQGYGVMLLDNTDDGLRLDEKTIAAIEATPGVELLWHEFGGDSKTPVIVIEDSHRWAYRGDNPAFLGCSLPIASPGWAAKIREAAEKASITLLMDIGWYMFLSGEDD